MRASEYITLYSVKKWF